jgi:hypothetical protein
MSFVQTNMSRTVFHESASLEDKKNLRKKNGSTQFFFATYQ